MVPFSRDLALSYWLAAAASEFGKGFAIDLLDAKNIINRMYEVRDEANDPRLANLTLRVIDEGKIWIYRKEVQLED